MEFNELFSKIQENCELIFSTNGQFQYFSIKIKNESDKFSLKFDLNNDFIDFEHETCASHCYNCSILGKLHYYIMDRKINIFYDIDRKIIQMMDEKEEIGIELDASKNPYLVQQQIVIRY